MVNLKTLRDRPLFICGHPKAGTSLLRNLFDSHPELVVYPEESMFFRSVLQKFDGLPDAQKVDAADELLLHIFTWNQDEPPPSQSGYPDRDYSHISFDAVRNAYRALLETYPARHSGDYLAAALIAYGQTVSQVSPETRAWVEKSPYNEYFTDKIFKWWPDARCIHIIRDPRDNFASYKRKQSSWTAKFFAVNWLRSTRTGFTNAKKYSSDKYLLITYESLVTQLEITLQKISAFAGIRLDASLETPTRTGRLWKGNSMFSDRFSGINAAPIGRWKEQLESAEADVISWITRREMRALGYAPNTGISPGIRLDGSIYTFRQLAYLFLKNKREQR